MTFAWRQRIACALIALVASLGVWALETGGCGRSPVPYCPVQRLLAPPAAPVAAASIPAPLKFALVAFLIIFLSYGGDPLPSAMRARLVWRRRHLDPRLPRDVPWHDAFLPYAVAMRDP